MTLYQAFQSRLQTYADSLSIQRTGNDSVSGLLAKLTAAHGSIVGQGGTWDNTLEALLEQAVSDAGYTL